MDENYLDDLLNGMSTTNVKKNKNFDNEVNMDSGIDIDMSDLGDLSLDELDELDNLDLGDLDLDDIDFDDVDVTNINPKSQPKESTPTEEQEDFSLDALVAEESKEEEESGEAFDFDAFAAEFAKSEEESGEAFDFDAFAADTAKSDENATGQGVDFAALDEGASGDMDLDDLFSALGIENEEAATDVAATASDENDLDALFGNAVVAESDDDLSDLMDIADVNQKSKSKKKSDGPKKKKTVSEILFGEPDEDDIEEEKLLEIKKAQKEAKKLAKQEQKQAKQESRDNAKKQSLEQKKQVDNAKKQEKLKKKKAKEAEYLAELEEEKDEKKVSTATVVIVFSIFFALAILVVVGTRAFDYSQAIKKAKDYFERHRYNLAYNEISGVDVKEDDQELRDRIYTVMYVERLYESYENNMALGRPDKALDALVRGLEKYDVHYEEAVELNVVEDIDICKEKILLALETDFGLNEEGAYLLMQLEGQVYSQTLSEYCEIIGMGE